MQSMTSTLKKAAVPHCFWPVDCVKFNNKLPNLFAKETEGSQKINFEFFFGCSVGISLLSSAYFWIDVIKKCNRTLFILSNYWDHNFRILKVNVENERLTVEWLILFLIPSLSFLFSAYKQHLVWLLGCWLWHIWIQPIHRRGWYPSVQTSSCCWKAWVTGSVSFCVTGWVEAGGASFDLSK